LVGYLLLAPALSDRSADVASAMVAVAPTLGDLLAIGAVAVLLLRGPSPQLRSTLLLVALAIGVTVGADLRYAQAMRTGAYQSGDLIDASWLFGNALFVVAAVTAADADAAEGSSADRWWARLADALPLGGMFVGFAALLALALDGGEPRPWLAAGAGLLCVLVGVRQLHLVVQNAGLHAALAVQYDKSERVLANLLPAAVAARLKERPKDAIADQIDDATVLFADIVGFTPLSATMGPEALLRLLDDVFSRFDRVAERHGLEKIKTIGDAYMAAAGVPDPREGHAADAARAGLAMIAAIDEINRERGLSLQLRVGLHSGPVVAGVIGTQKRVYDLWGDAVNTASRMESHGVPHAVQITAATRARLGDGFVPEARGNQEIKGKGVMETRLLRGA
jgi:class 3 adenylate cyclase